MTQPQPLPNADHEHCPASPIREIRRRPRSRHSEARSPRNLGAPPVWPRPLCWAYRLRGWLVFAVVAVVLPHAAGEDSIRIADDLTIRLVADDELIPDCTNIACDWNGQVVASGPKYIRRLIDRDADGVYDDFETLVDDLKHGAHGLCFVNPYLYYVANDGVWRRKLSEDAARRESASERVLSVKTGGEHHAHALRMGPDGFWYLIAGNGTPGANVLQNVARTEVPNPRAGVLWRISPNWQQREVWAHGFRNAYDFDFGPHHSIVTFDSDGEREVSLPWYRPTRVYRVQRGEDAGWLTRNWKRPNYAPDMPSVLAEFGRGSPTGVLRYRHRRLPARFHGTTFVLDWTFGRLLCVADSGRTELVAEPRGTAGFALTDIAALADGRLVLSVGGRGSRGGLYLVDAKSPGPASAHNSPDWSASPASIELDPLRSRIRRLRTQATNTIDLEAIQWAFEQLTIAKAEDGQLAAITLAIEALGGLGEATESDPRPAPQRAAVFDGYRSQLPPVLPSALKEGFVHTLANLLQPSSPRNVRREAVRALAVLQAGGEPAQKALVADMMRCTDPTEKLHRLIAIGRLHGEISPSASEQICQAMVDIPVQIVELQRHVDRNWSPRLSECLRALLKRDSTFAKRLVNHDLFGHPSHLVWTEGLSTQWRRQACRRFMLHADGRRAPAVARFVAEQDVVVPRAWVEDWLANDATRLAAWLVMAAHPSPDDANELQQAAASFDAQVAQRAADALKKLGIQRAKPNRPSTDVEAWIARSDKIFSLVGNEDLGKSLFTIRQCAKCHNSAKALGPSLAGIGKRFSNPDLLRATVDPSHTIPDRYRSLQVLTVDGEILTGIKIYESVDGVTLLSADARTMRINAASIEAQKLSTRSIMPEGLLDGASDQDVADLLAYLRAW